MMLWQWFYSINYTSAKLTREFFVDCLHTSWACIPFSAEGKWTCISALQVKLPVCSMAIPKFKFSSTDSITSHAFRCFSGDIIVINFCNSWKRKDIPIKKPQYEKQFYSTVDSLYLRNSSFLFRNFKCLLLCNYYSQTTILFHFQSFFPYFWKIIPVWLHLTCSPILLYPIGYI